MQTQKQNKDINNILNEAIKAYKARSLPKAERLLKNYIKLDSTNAEAWYYMGLIAFDVKKYPIAIELFNKSLSIKPYEQAFLKQGNCFYELKDFDNAINCFKNALKISPKFIGAYNNIGVLYNKQDKLDEAIEYYYKGLEINPNNADLYSNLGVALNKMGRTGEAIKSHHKALNLNPKHIDANYNLGVAYMSNREVTKAIECYEKTLKLNPKYMDAYLNIAIAYFINNQFDLAWKNYEYRFNNRKEPKPTGPNKPKWDGCPLDGKVLYVYHEQGFGDTIQFVRFFDCLKSFNAKKILFKTQAGLENIMKMSLPNVDIINHGMADKFVEYDYYVLLLSLPYILKINKESIPSTTRYLKPDINKVIAYKHKFFNNNKFKVGIFWQGSTEYKDDKNRSLTLEFFYPLSQIPNVQLYSLQKGYGSEQLANIPDNINIINLGETFRDFSDTAAAIENLDLVITVDSAVAHLTGALGKPVWIILSSNLEWRWFLDEDTTIWYNTAKLFRPKLGQDKSEVMDRIISELKKLQCEVV